MSNQYKRILLKLSGESLMGEKQYGIDEKRVNEYATQIKEIAEMGIEIGIVIGGGNIFRGLSGTTQGVDRVKGDQMGMLATVINSLALSSALEKVGQKARVFTAIIDGAETHIAVVALLVYGEYGAVACLDAIVGVAPVEGPCVLVLAVDAHEVAPVGAVLERTLGAPLVIIVRT